MVVLKVWVYSFTIHSHLLVHVVLPGERKTACTDSLAARVLLTGVPPINGLVT